MKAMVARDVMNPDLLAVPIGMTARELADFLTEHEITGAPVVDEAGRFVGVVSVTDVAEARETAALVGDSSDPDRELRGWEDRLSPEDLRPLRVSNESPTVGEIMTPTVYTVPEETPVAEMARTMVAGRIHRLFVTRRGEIVGIVTSLDLLKLLIPENPA